MKKYFLFAQLICILIALFGNSCSDSNNETPSMDCREVSFKENYLENIKNDNVFFIKGEVLDEVKYGLKIRLIEDLKGNFPKNVTTFTTWGADFEGALINRWDALWRDYNKQDVLIMLLVQADLGERFQNLGLPEKRGDYSTCDCAYSVLKLSDDGYVTGFISPKKERAMWYENMSKEEMESFTKDMSPKEYWALFWETMQWDELKMILNFDK